MSERTLCNNREGVKVEQCRVEPCRRCQVQRKEPEGKATACIGSGQRDGTLHTKCYLLVSLLVSPSAYRDAWGIHGENR